MAKTKCSRQTNRCYYNISEEELNSEQHLFEVNMHWSENTPDYHPDPIRPDAAESDTLVD